MLLTVPLMPVQAALLALDTRRARTFPHWYHRQVCRLLGVRLKVTGAVVRDAPVLVIANHVSWLDIPVISAVAPVSFVAKKEVAGWPFVSALAKLQRSVFVDRERRAKVGDTTNEIVARLQSGDAIVLFAEGTSSDGNRVLPFKTSLFAAAIPSGPPPRSSATSATLAAMPQPRTPVVVQTLSIVYTRNHGLPLGWAGRRALGYYGDIGMGDNAWHVLSGGPLEATIRISEPVSLDTFKDRKALAKWAETTVRAGRLTALRGGRG
jgi:lyso-ornithine lipid O-acyltransferase